MKPNFRVAGYFLLPIVLVVGTLFSCSPANAPAPAPLPGCLPPPVPTVPTSMGERRAEFGQGRTPRAITYVGWQKQFSFTANFGDEHDYDGVNAAASDGAKLWVSLGRHITVYDLETKSVKDYFLPGIGLGVFSIFDIFVSQDGTVWSLVYDPRVTRLALAHYNPTMDQFEIVSDQEHILERAGQNNSGAVFFVASQVLAETTDGKLLMAFGKNIILYDHLTNFARYVLPKDFQFSISAIAVSKNLVWFTTGQDLDLRSVNLSTGDIQDYGPAPSTLNKGGVWSYYMIPYAFRPIGIDALGRIWVGYFARLQLDKSGHYTWEQVTYPPEFVVVDDPEHKSLWAMVYSIYTSQKGDLWFDTTAGLVKYDVVKYRWCMSATFDSKMALAEDYQGDLWLLARSSTKGHDIYKYGFPGP